jgi:hypothetical protein
MLRQIEPAKSRHSTAEHIMHVNKMYSRTDAHEAKVTNDADE